MELTAILGHTVNKYPMEDEVPLKRRVLVITEFLSHGFSGRKVLGHSLTPGVT